MLSGNHIHKYNNILEHNIHDLSSVMPCGLFQFRINFETILLIILGGLFSQAAGPSQEMTEKHEHPCTVQDLNL
jgi:hypothetical protein